MIQKLYSIFYYIFSCYKTSKRLLLLTSQKFIFYFTLFPDIAHSQRINIMKHLQG